MAEAALLSVVKIGTCLAGEDSRAGLLLLKKFAVAEGNVRTGKSRARSKIEPCLKKSLVCEGISGMRGCCCC